MCRNCKHSSGYELLPKSKVKERYLLTDTDLANSDLPTLNRSNPQNRNWNAMNLYLRRQVEEVSFRKWGGPQQIEEERERQFEKRVSQHASRKRKLQKQAPQEAKLASLRARIEDDTPHNHVYDETPTENADGTCTKTCSVCGMAVTYEEL